MQSMPEQGSKKIDSRTSCEEPSFDGYRLASSIFAAFLVIAPTLLLLARWREGPIDALVERILGIPSVATQTVLLACVVVGFLLTRKSRHYSSFDRIINAAAMVVLLTIVAAMAISLLSHI
jgi:hypothetical protein